MIVHLLRPHHQRQIHTVYLKTPYRKCAKCCHVASAPLFKLKEILTHVHLQIKEMFALALGRIMHRFLCLPYLKHYCSLSLL